MNRLPMSAAATALLRALLARASVARDRILLTEYRSVDWQSLTFVGERHEMRFRIPGPAADVIVRGLTQDLDAAEFTLPGQFVADITIDPTPREEKDGSISFGIEALTLAD
jgi:hypothetical protein